MSIPQDERSKYARLNRRKDITRMHAMGFSLLLLSVMTLVYVGMLLRQGYDMPIDEPAARAVLTPPPGPKEAWTSWLEADSAQFDTAYFIRNLEPENKALCNGIYRSVIAFEEEIILPEPINKELLSELMWLIKYDCPELFQISGEYTYYVRQNEPDMVISVCPTYCMTKSEYELAIEDIEDQLRLWREQAEGLDVYLTQKLIYDGIMELCEYKETGEHTGSAYGALVLGEARCEGYAQAVNLALRKAGMESILLTGEAREERTEGGEEVEKSERHAWNAAKVGEHFYQLDATWDDQQPVSYAYFNVTDDEMWRSRSLDAIYDRFSLPECNDMTYNYFVQAGAYVDETKPVKGSLYALLDRTLDIAQGQKNVLLKFKEYARFTELTEHLRDWMDQWYGEKGFSAGYYSWTAYPGSYVFCISDIQYS